MQKIKYLEGLRGVAAFMVILHHLHYACFVTYEMRLDGMISQWHTSGLVKTFVIDFLAMFSDGALAVWVFWVLSSYVISILFFKKGENYDKVVVGYFSKRYFRLAIPVLASIMFAYILLKLGCMHNSELAAKLGPPYFHGWLSSFYAFQPSFRHALLTGVYSSFFNFSFNDSYNTVVWTIQNELLGSLFTFSIFGIIRHNSKRFILYFVILAIVLKLGMFWLAAFVAGHILADYDFSDSQHSIILKLKKAEAFIHKFKIPIFILSVFAIVYSYQILWMLKVPEQAQRFMLGLFIVYLCLRNQWYKDIFSSKIPFWLGKISYSMYLIHLPIICSLTCYMVLQNTTLQGKIIASVVSIAVVFAASVLFRKYIDDNGVKIAGKVGSYFKSYTE